MLSRNVDELQACVVNLDTKGLNPTTARHTLVCWNDSEPFSGHIFGYPLKRICERSWVVRGVFCSIGCVQRYLLDRSMSHPLSLALFACMCTELYRVEEIYIPPSPLCIDKYIPGGITIDSYRTGSSTTYLPLHSESTIHVTDTVCAVQVNETQDDQHTTVPKSADPQQERSQTEVTHCPFTGSKTQRTPSHEEPMSTDLEYSIHCQMKIEESIEEWEESSTSRSKRSLHSLLTSHGTPPDH